MSHDHKDTSRLVPEDAFPAVDRALEFIVSYTHAKGGAAVFCPDRPLAPRILSHNLNPQQVGKLDALWTEHGTALRSGQRIERVGFRLMPVRASDGDLLAYVYLLWPTTYEPNGLHHVWKTLTDAAESYKQGPSAKGEYLLSRTPEDIERERMLHLLEKHQWNIRLVASLLGVTRRTIYLRLQRYNIPRKRIRKTRPRRRRTQEV